MSSYATAPVMIWELAGRPHRPTLGVTDTPGTCAMCARTVEATAPAKKWLENKSFTDPKHLRAKSDRVCEACAWCCTGKGMDQIRMWSIVAREDKALPASNPKAVFASDHLHFTSRADMRAVVNTLAHPPAGEWVVSIAESGQKHTTPYSVINHGAGRWRVRMDALNIDGTPADFALVFSHVVALRQAGHSADAIEHLNPSFAAMKSPDAVTTWFHHAAALACKAAVAISGYPSELYDTMLHAWHRHEIPARTGGRGTRTRPATEVLWVNRPPKTPPDLLK